MTSLQSFRRVLIVADDSADWIVAGLRQLERLALAVDEFAVENRETAPVLVCIFWRPDLDRSQRWVPRHSRLTKVAFTQDLDGQAYDLVLNTRLFLYRGAVRHLLPEGRASARPPTFAGVPPSEEELWQAWFRSLESLPPSQPGAWESITTGDQIDGIEIRFLRGSGKSQDGLVSRYLNRPISRRVTRLFLRFPTTPNGWTWSIFIIPLLALLILFQGTYWSFVWGLVLYQLFSVLDGCDGELARATFLESERGRRLDAFCDVLSNILLVLGLGGGLSRQAALAGSSGWFYFLEGVVAAALIGVNESWLEMKNPGSGQEKPVSLSESLYPRHRELVERSGLLALGGNFASWVIQLTKRDVAVLFFVFLALIGLPAVILHLLFIVTAVTLALSFKSFSRS
jgi:CDP-alcohol phosphatidyltransferase